MAVSGTRAVEIVKVTLSGVAATWWRSSTTSSSSFTRQLIAGVGLPSMLHVMWIVSPSVTITLSGAVSICAGTENVFRKMVTEEFCQSL